MKKSLWVRKPNQIGLLIQNVSDTYVFALKYDFCLSNNYQYYSRYLLIAFSMEEYH